MSVVPTEQISISEYDPDFPDLEDERATSVVVRENYNSPYKNLIRSNDSITVCPGFINQVRKVGDRYYIKAGLVAGSVPVENSYRASITNVELRVGATLKKWAEIFGGLDRSCASVRVKFFIRNLKYQAQIKNGQAVLETRGTIETIEFGHVD